MSFSNTQCVAGIVTVTGGCREVARSDFVSCDGNRILPLGGCFGSENPKCGPRDEMSLALVQIANTSRQSLRRGAKFRPEAPRSRLQVQLDLERRDVPVGTVPSECDAATRCQRL